MLNLIASTMTFRTYPLDRALYCLRENGFDTVELCAVGTWVPHFDVEHADDRTLSAAVRTFREAGMKLHCVNTGSYAVEAMEYAYALARELGAKIVTNPCGSPVEGRERVELLRERAEYNARMADLGEKYGVTASVEAPHKRSLAESAAQIDEYWSMQDERVRCTFDVAHLTYAGEDMLAAAKKYVPRIAHIHLRDAVKGNSLLRYGEGTVDFARFLKTVKDSGYAGKFSMEYPADSDAEALERIKASAEYLSKFDI